MVIMYLYNFNFNKITNYKPSHTPPKTNVSIIIPARNEAQNIATILNCLLQQKYPINLFEIIVIDDFSEDETYKIANDFTLQNKNIRVFKLENLLKEKTNTYKKRAIELAVQQANGQLIITTDADCTMQQNWLSTIVNFYENNNNKLIASPVLLEHNNTFFQKFQSLDFCGMQLITAASLQMQIFNMANGANLAYEKSAFLAVEGYKNIDQKASGDDMLLVYKIAEKYKNSVAFLKNKDAIVSSVVAKSLKDFLQQRFRWTSKSGNYQDKKITFILASVFLFCVTIFINLFLSIFNIKFLYIAIFQIISKSIFDYIVLKNASKFFNKKQLMQTFFISEIYHLLYIVLVGFFGNILSYNWKGRQLK